jgi:hypothetical protein
MEEAEGDRKALKREARRHRRHKRQRNKNKRMNPDEHAARVTKRAEIKRKRESKFCHLSFPSTWVEPCRSGLKAPNPAHKSYE